VTQTGHTGPAQAEKEKGTLLASLSAEIGGSRADLNHGDDGEIGGLMFVVQKSLASKYARLYL
jgi:hypothetical protein